MTTGEFKKLFDRIKRIQQGLGQKSGAGFVWDYTFPDGDTHSYRITNLKKPEEIEDDVTHLFLCVWNAKDYVKELVRQKGGDQKEIERIVNSDRNLSICADVANYLKHSVLKKRPRSGHYCRLGDVKYEIPQSCVKGLKFGDHYVETNVSNPDCITLTMAIKDEQDNILGDAFECLERAIIKWESVLSSLNLKLN
ncbi:MAG: hypothetical protein PHY43_10180 [Verrucomicrobiales bacterium]|nr:hypothetical protein [Verrucomicrobiales bacterium]